MRHLSRFACAIVCMLVVTPAMAQERVLRAELELSHAPDAVWSWWTTEAGIKSFLAPGARIEPRVDGEFDVLFSPDAPPGQRGAEGLRIIAFEPPRGTRLTFLHWSWGAGKQWDAAYDYFDKAWSGFVLPALKHRDAHGAIDWKKPPTLAPLFPSLKHDLAGHRLPAR